MSFWAPPVGGGIRITGGPIFPNAPANLTTLVEAGGTSAVPWVTPPTQSDGPYTGMPAAWSVLNPGGNGSAVTDATLPDGTNGLNFNYPIGFAPGGGPVTPYILPSASREGFIGVIWRADTPYRYPDGSGNQKIVYCDWNENATTFLAVESVGLSAPAEFQILPVNQPDARATLHTGVTSTPGTAYRLEVYYKQNSDSGADGVIKMWVSTWTGVWSVPELGINISDFQFANNAGQTHVALYGGWNGASNMTAPGNNIKYNRFLAMAV